MNETNGSKDHPSSPQSNQSELIKFALLVGLLLGSIILLSLAAPPLIEQIIPVVLGLEDGPSSLESVQVQPLAPAKQTAPPEPATGGLEQADPGNQGSMVIHVVQEGESLHQIAASYGISVEALAAVNHLVSIQQLQAGTELSVPVP